MVGIGECTTHFRLDFSGDRDVHWGYDLDFDPGSKCPLGRPKMPAKTQEPGPQAGVWRGDKWNEAKKPQSVDTELQ